MGLEILFEKGSPSLCFEIDTYWIQAGGGDPTAWIRKTKGRAPLVHFKDVGLVDRQFIFAEVGEGNLNWIGIIEACKEAGTVWHIVEQDRHQRDPFESVAISLRNMKAMGLK